MTFVIGSVDKSKREQGVWKSYRGGSFLIAHTSSNGFQREFSRLQRPYKHQIDKDKLDTSVYKEILCEAMAKEILLDWKDVADTSGKNVKYTQEVAYQAMFDDDDFREFIQEVAGDLDNYRTELVEDTVKQ
jgi:hypothetical protein